MCAGSTVYSCPARALLLEGDSSLGAAPSTAVSHPGPGPSVSFPTRRVPRRGAASPGCALGGRSPWRMSWSRWRRRWSSGYPQLGGGAGPGGMLWPKEGEGRAPPPLRPAPPSRPQPGTSCLVGLPRGPLRWCSLRLLTAPFSVVAPVRPLWRTRHSCGRRAGQGRAGKCLLCWLKLLFLAP